ncbi:SH3 domain-containing protein [Leptolyngbya sp. PCC 6406]|uniref:SH3 domain-containing protein n=1 Tax=Leptolyngbya sp. PCC 6406 TaxID=1173264 RepID=UPI0002AC8E7A|nr:SH3 domain-containing protein [Leptolyngbya sp. PCC 6406]
MKGCLVGLSKLLLGSFLALVLLSLAGVATARYFMAQLAMLPPKPVFSNDAPPAVSPSVPSEEAVNGAEETPPAVAETEPEAAPSEPAPPGSYEAVVSQPIGLVLRSGPGTEFERMGGVDHNTPILVLKSSDDGEWLNIRLTSTGQEGWIKAGNSQRRDTTPEPVSQ